MRQKSALLLVLLHLHVLNIGFLSHFSFPKTLFPSFLHHLCLQFLYPTNFLGQRMFFFTCCNLKFGELRIKETRYVYVSMVVVGGQSVLKRDKLSGGTRYSATPDHFKLPVLVRPDQNAQLKIG